MTLEVLSPVGISRSGGDEGEANKMRDGSAELKDICDQLDRYGTGTMPDCFLDLLWALTDINDCLAHDRNPAITREAINMARALLDVLEEGL